MTAPNHETTSYSISAEEEARSVMINYQRDIHSRVECEPPHLRSFALRWAEVAWRIALIFHCSENGDQAHLKPVTEQTALNAVQVMRWFARHQQQLLERGQEQTDNDKMAVALAFVNKSSGGATAWEVYRSRQTLFENATDARSALDQLESEGAIVGEQSRKSRRFFRKAARNR